MSIKKSLFVLVMLGMVYHQLYAAEVSGWSVGSSGMWRLQDDPDHRASKGSPAKFLRIDRAVPNREVRYVKRAGLVNTFVFRVGCAFQSKTPVFELDVQPLDIRIADQFNGYAFAHFLVDDSQEYSLRGEYIPPARLIFAPLTKSQEKFISDIFLQLGEGGMLKIAILQGVNADPRIFELPLTGFMELSGEVLKDCVKLNQISGSRSGYLPEYLTKEPSGYVVPKWSLKKPIATDGLSLVKENTKESSDTTSVVPEIKYFEPGGAPASIGSDGKPLVQEQVQDVDSGSNDLGATQGAMRIGPDGMPMVDGVGGGSTQQSQETP